MTAFQVWMKVVLSQHYPDQEQKIIFCMSEVDCHEFCCDLQTLLSYFRKFCRYIFTLYGEFLSLHMMTTQLRTTYNDLFRPSSVGWLVGWSACHDFILKGRGVSRPCSYRRNCLFCEMYKSLDNLEKLICNVKHFREDSLIKSIFFSF